MWHTYTSVGGEWTGSTRRCRVCLVGFLGSTPGGAGCWWFSCWPDWPGRVDRSSLALARSGSLLLLWFFCVFLDLFSFSLVSSTVFFSSSCFEVMLSAPQGACFRVLLICLILVFPFPPLSPNLSYLLLLTRCHDYHSRSSGPLRGNLEVRVRLLLCVSIPSSIVSANRFSSCIVRRLLLCISITVDPASAFTLACQPKSVLVENADAC